MRRPEFCAQGPSAAARAWDQSVRHRGTAFGEQPAGATETAIGDRDPVVGQRTTCSDRAATAATATAAQRTAVDAAAAATAVGVGAVPTRAYVRFALAAGPVVLGGHHGGTAPEPRARGIDQAAVLDGEGACG